MNALPRPVSALAATTMVSAALVGAPTPAAATPPAPGLLWNPSPVLTPANPSVLVAATATARTDVWAVGSYGDWWRRQPQAHHWDGTRWRPYQVPLGDAPDGVLSGVDADPTGDVWAVGSADSGRRTLITRFRAGTWSVVPSPSPGIGGYELNDVDGGWAVGAYHESVGGTDRENLILRWNGTAWTQVPAPNASTGTNVLTSVSASGPNDAWAVGYLTKQGEGVPRETVILRWDGQTWQRVPSPNLSPPETNLNLLNAVTAISPTEAWAVGTTSSQGWSTRRPVALRWNGVSWTPRPTPGDAEALEYTDIAAVTPGRVYFSGYRGRFTDQNMLVRWTGTHLLQETVEVPTTGTGGPSEAPIGTALHGIAAAPTGEVWAVGHLANMQNRVVHRAP